jgi:hypothetical protein
MGIATEGGTAGTRVGAAGGSSAADTGGGATAAAASGRSASSRARAEGKRSSGDLASRRATIASSSADTCGADCLTDGGGACECRRASSARTGASNGMLPVSSSCITTPSA